MFYMVLEYQLDQERLTIFIFKHYRQLQKDIYLYYFQMVNQLVFKLPNIKHVHQINLQFYSNNLA